MSSLLGRHSGLQHHARPRGVRVRGERALQMPSNIFRQTMFATTPPLRVETGLVAGP